jgi:hypothetical protein
MEAMSPFHSIQVLVNEGIVIWELTFEAPQPTAQPMEQCITNEVLGQDGETCISRGDNAVRAYKVVDAVLAR